MTEESISYPIRINHYLAIRQYCSRRMADQLIALQKVKINGQIAKIGQQVQRNDRVEVNAETMKQIGRNRVFLAFNKPVDIVTHGPQKNEKSIADILHYPMPLFPIGRLDKDSHGLIILTNDGRITDRLLNPKYSHQKEYLVRVNKKLRPGFLDHIRKGIDLSGYRTKPAQAHMFEPDRFRIVLTEGRHRQIRKMCSAFNYQVLDLKRVRIMNITLGRLPPGKYRKIEGAELINLLQALNLKTI